jgi:hypothetical protein
MVEAQIPEARPRRSIKGDKTSDKYFLAKSFDL